MNYKNKWFAVGFDGNPSRSPSGFFTNNLKRIIVVAVDVVVDVVVVVVDVVAAQMKILNFSNVYIDLISTKSEKTITEQDCSIYL